MSRRLLVALGSALAAWAAMTLVDWYFSGELRVFESLALACVLGGVIYVIIREKAR